MQFPIYLRVLCAASVILGASHCCGQSPQSWSAPAEVVEQQSSRRAEFNYHESRVPAYTLPDPLRFSDGRKVDSADLWNERRAELLELFRSQVYGRRPQTAYEFDVEVLTQVDDAFEGAAVGRSMNASVLIDGRRFEFPITLFIPKGVDGRVPAVVHINNRYFVSLDRALGEHDPFWPVRTLVSRGYATASFHTSDVDPDNRDGYADGIRAFFSNGQPPADDAWRSLSAWGWAASRILDHLATLPEIDATRAAVVGHSRGGKTALWAAAEDERFAIAYSNDSGCGGAALSRRRYGETVGRITSSFPHWFSPNFARYAGREDDLPIDQHELIALLAPRGAYVASADEDLWADPRGEYLALVGASEVYHLLGAAAISDPIMPPLDQSRVVGKTGYHIREGGHGLGDLDWRFFLDFADGLLK